MTANDKLIGKVKFFSESRGYGYIAADDGDFYFHVTGLLGEPALKFGDIVTFIVISNPKGPRAEKIQRLTLEDIKNITNERKNEHEERKNK